MEEGPAEDVTAIGWQLHDEHALPLLRRRLRAMGVDVAEAGAAEAAARGVERLWVFQGPKKLRFEFFTRPLLAGRRA